MTPRLRAEVTQLSIVSGAQQVDAGNTGQVASSSLIPGRTGKGNLYLLVQLSGEPMGKAQLQRELIAILGEEYSRVPGGVTNGIRQAIKVANDFLYRRNLEALPLWQRIGQACCAVLRGRDLYVGVAGEAQIYVVQDDQVRVFPPDGPRYASETPGAERQHPTPLGVEESLGHVALFHCPIHEDSRIILASGELSKVARPDRLARAAPAGAEHLANTLESLASGTDLSALIIELQPADRVAPPKPRPAIKRKPIAAGRPVPSKTREPYRPAGGAPVRGIAAGFLALVLAFGARVLSFFSDVARKIGAFFSWLVSSGILGTIGRGIRRLSVALLQGLGT
ncbi:MAG TPA: hypothetical protein ENO24_09690, partial [Chloroflexi bacterium]|nr:hypothetical protein [Chloroflexota bacterium]